MSKIIFHPPFIFGIGGLSHKCSPHRACVLKAFKNSLHETLSMCRWSWPRGLCRSHCRAPQRLFTTTICSHFHFLFRWLCYACSFCCSSCSVRRSSFTHDQTPAPQTQHQTLTQHKSSSMKPTKRPTGDAFLSLGAGLSTLMVQVRRWSHADSARSPPQLPWVFQNAPQRRLFVDVFTLLVRTRN